MTVAGRVQRATAALTDTAAVEHHAPGMVRVVTFGGAYVVDVRDEVCSCPDYNYNLEGRGHCKHIHAALAATDQLGVDIPGIELEERLDERAAEPQPVATDGGGEWVVRGEKPTGEVVEQTADSRAEAEEMREQAESVGLSGVTIEPPQSTGAADRETDGGQHPDRESVEVVEVEQDTQSAPDTTETDDGVELPERSVAEDPLNWVPGEFVDEIDGSQAINRKGFEVLSHFYDISVETEIVVPPEETDHEYCRAVATATTPDGRECQAHGSAHVDRGDDSYLLLEMADTRARKRALSIATGVGAVAVAELKSEVTHG